VPHEASGEKRSLKRTLRAIDLVAIGIGIFVLPGQAAAIAGPGLEADAAAWRSRLTSSR